MSPRLPEAYYSTEFILGDHGETLPPTFAVVTACNPMDAIASEAANAEADRALKARLQTEGFPHFRATGCSPDRSHKEPGWALVAPLATALELARCYDQRALWWVENDQLLLVACDDALPHEVAPFAERLCQD